MVEVVAALIWKGGRFMICRRPPQKARGLLWEFVGGKVEPGERKEDALVRECREELAVTVRVGDVFCDVVHTYPDITVHLTLFHASIAEGEPQLLEHCDLQWITPAQIPAYEFCPADKTVLERITAAYGSTPEIVRVTTEEDLAWCISLRFAVFVDEQNVPPELEEDEYDTLDAPCVHFLITSSDSPIGTFRCIDEGEGTYHLGRLCLLPSYRGRGYGRAALAAAEDYCRAQGGHRMVLGAQCQAIGFYESCGYRVISDIFDDAGIPHRQMERML